jgi:hypothetical protein
VFCHDQNVVVCIVRSLPFYMALPSVFFCVLGKDNLCQVPRDFAHGKEQTTWQQKFFW